MATAKAKKKSAAKKTSTTAKSAGRSSDGAAKPSAKSTAKKTVTKKAGAKKAAKKSAAKRAAAKKPAAKRAAAKKPAAKRAAAKKLAAKKGVRSTPKRPAAVERRTAKKGGAKKSGAKKISPKRATPKKGGAKKTAAKKIATRSPARRLASGKTSPVGKVTGAKTRATPGTRKREAVRNPAAAFVAEAYAAEFDETAAPETVDVLESLTVETTAPELVEVIEAEFVDDDSEMAAAVEIAGEEPETLTALEPDDDDDVAEVAAPPAANDETAPESAERVASSASASTSETIDEDPQEVENDDDDVDDDDDDVEPAPLGGPTYVTTTAEGKVNGKFGRSLLAGEVSIAEIQALTTDFEQSDLLDEEFLDGSVYDVVVVDGDLHVDGDFSTFANNLTGLVVRGSFTIRGLYTDTDDPACAVAVAGDMTASRVITTGALEIGGTLTVTDALVGFYNDYGARIGGDLVAPLFAPENHHFAIQGRLEAKHVVGYGAEYRVPDSLREHAKSRLVKNLREVFTIEVIGGDESLGDDELELRPDVLRAWVREGKSVFRPGGA